MTPLPSLSAVLPTNAPIVDWWSMARNVTGAKGVSNDTPSAAAIILSVSVEPALVRIAAIPFISE